MINRPRFPAAARGSGPSRFLGTVSRSNSSRPIGTLMVVTIRAMNEAWELLCALGLPDGPIRPPPTGPFPDERVRAALESVLAGPLEERQIDPLLAWLRAWQHHWPARFGSALADSGEAAIRSLELRSVDANRYLKLRRIAI